MGYSQLNNQLIQPWQGHLYFKVKEKTILQVAYVLLNPRIHRVTEAQVLLCGGGPLGGPA